MLGKDTTLGDDELKTLLLIVVRNATTDSPWPLSNNPNALFNDPSREDNNLAIPLWQLVRASTAAPTYFPPEVVTVGEHDFVFVDGGVDDVQQSRLPAVPDGDARCIPAGLAGNRIRSPARFGGHGYVPQGRRPSATRSHESAVQRKLGAGGVDACRAQRARPAVPGVRPLSTRCADRLGGRRPDAAARGC